VFRDAAEAEPVGKFPARHDKANAETAAGVSRRAHKWQRCVPRNSLRSKRHIVIAVKTVSRMKWKLFVCFFISSSFFELTTSCRDQNALRLALMLATCVTTTTARRKQLARLHTM